MDMKHSLKELAIGTIIALASPMVLAIAVDDVTFKGMDSDQAEYLSGNDDEDAIDAIFGAPPSWTQVLKYDVPATQDTGSFGGIDFTLDGNSGTSGTFTLSWFADPDNLLPAFMDMVFVLKAGNAFAGYLFEDEKIDNQSGGSGSSDGTWDITFTNNGGNIPNLSHLSLYMRTGDEPDTPNETVPVPGTLLLLGLGLIGLRFRSKA